MPNDLTDAHKEDERHAVPDPPPEKPRVAKLACRDCGREILDLETLAIGPESVIVISNCRETGKVEHLRRWLGEHGFWGVLVVDMRGEQKLAQLPPDAMERAGWVRRPYKGKARGETGE
jgi:hypothetical protein